MPKLAISLISKPKKFMQFTNKFFSALKSAYNDEEKRKTICVNSVSLLLLRLSQQCYVRIPLDYLRLFYAVIAAVIITLGPVG